MLKLGALDFISLGALSARALPGNSPTAGVGFGRCREHVAQVVTELDSDETERTSHRET